MDSRYYSNLLIHVMNDGTVFLLPTVLPLIVLEYGFTYGIAGLISAIIPFCLGVFQTPVGRLSDRLPCTLLLRVGILVVAAGALVVGLVPILFIPGMFIIGIGGSFYHPAGYAYTSKIIKNERTGAALGLQSGSGDSGTLIAFLTAGSLVILAGWRSVFITWGILCVASFVVSSIFFRGKSDSGDHIHSMPEKLSILKSKDAVLIVILFGILGAVQRVLSTYLPSLFFIGGSSINIADGITALLIGAGIAGEVLVGRLVDRFEGRNISLLSFASAAVFLVVMFLVSQLLVAALLVAAVGLVITGLYPVYYFMMRRVTSVKLVGVSYGLLLSVGMLSGMASLTAGGYIIDISPSMLFLFAASLALAGAILSLGLPHLNHRS
jgi:MFS family permease